MDEGIGMPAENTSIPQEMQQEDGFLSYLGDLRQDAFRDRGGRMLITVQLCGKSLSAWAEAPDSGSHIFRASPWGSTNSDAFRREAEPFEFSSAQTVQAVLRMIELYAALLLLLELCKDNEDQKRQVLAVFTRTVMPDETEEGSAQKLAKAFFIPLELARAICSSVSTLRRANQREGSGLASHTPLCGLLSYVLKLDECCKQQAQLEGTARLRSVHFHDIAILRELPEDAASSPPHINRLSIGMVRKESLEALHARICKAVLNPSPLPQQLTADAQGAVAVFQESFFESGTPIRFEVIYYVCCEPWQAPKHLRIGNGTASPLISADALLELRPLMCWSEFDLTRAVNLVALSLILPCHPPPHLSRRAQRGLERLPVFQVPGSTITVSSRTTRELNELACRVLDSAVRCTPPYFAFDSRIVLSSSTTSSCRILIGRPTPRLLQTLFTCKLPDDCLMIVEEVTYMTHNRKQVSTAKCIPVALVGGRSTWCSKLKAELEGFVKRREITDVLYELGSWSGYDINLLLRAALALCFLGEKKRQELRQLADSILACEYNATALGRSRHLIPAFRSMRERDAYDAGIIIAAIYSLLSAPEEDE
jgi:hypothetical protein